MNPKKSYFKLSDYALASMMAAMGIAVKVVAAPMAQLLTGPLFIPGGVAAGGFYMLFLVPALVVTRKRGIALLTALAQAILVTATGMPGSHGAASLITYTLPGLAVEAVWLLAGRRAGSALCCFSAGAAANITGSFSVNMLIFRLPAVPLLLSLCVAALSGGLGGWLAYELSHRINRLRIWRE